MQSMDVSVNAEDRLRIRNLCLRWFQAHINMLNILQEWVRKLSNSALSVGSNSARCVRSIVCAFLVGDGVLYRNACVLYETNYICTLWSPTVIQDSYTRFNRWGCVVHMSILSVQSFLRKTATFISTGQIGLYAQFHHTRAWFQTMGLA